MSDSTEAPASAATPTDQATTDFAPITTQEDLNKVISQRLERERAKFADYDDLRSKAERLDQIEEAKKDEIQKASERVAATERERDEARADSSRLRVAVKHGLSEEDAALLDSLSDEDAMNRLAERLAKQAGAPSVGFHVDQSATQSNIQPDKDDQARSFFGI